MTRHNPGSSDGTDIAATLDALFTALAKAAGVDRDELIAKVKDSPEFNKWRIKKVKRATDDRYWIAAFPAKRVGKVFPRVMPDGTSGHDAAKRYVESQYIVFLPPEGMA